MYKVILLIITALSFSFAKSQTSEQAIWKYAKIGSSASIEHLEADSSGNTYVIGSFTNEKFTYSGRSVPGIGEGKSNNLFVMKTDPSGKAVWLYSIRGTQIDCSIRFISLAINQRGEAALLYESRGTPEVLMGNKSIKITDSKTEAITSKISKTGFIIWQKKAEITGEVMNHMASDLVLDEDGNVYQLGSFQGESILFDDEKLQGTNNDALLYLCKYQTNGDMEWANTCRFGGDTISGNIYGRKLISGENDQLYISGYYNGVTTFSFGTSELPIGLNDNAFVASFTKRGEALWGVGFAGFNNEYDEALLTLQDNSLCFVGFTNSSTLSLYDEQVGSTGSNYDAVLLLINPDGEYINHQVVEVQRPFIYQGDENLKISATQDNAITLVTEFYSPQIFTFATEVGNSDPETADLIIARISTPELEPEWTLTGSGMGDNKLTDAETNKKGEVVLLGDISNSVKFENTDIVANADGNGFYLVKVLETGKLVYSYRRASAAEQIVTSKETHFDQYGNIYTAGNFYGEPSLLGKNILEHENNQGFYLAKYAPVNTISGMVTRTDEVEVSDGFVKIFGYSYRQKSPLSDSVRINIDGSFSFEDLPQGKYILYVESVSSENPSFIPVYFPSEPYWEDAIQIDLSSSENLTNIEIMVSPIIENNGAGTIEGYVEAITESDLFKSTMGQPRPKARCKLAKKKPKATDDIIYLTETDENGNFSFSGIPDGDYWLFLDITGLPNEDVYFITLSGGNYYGNLDFFVSEETVAIKSPQPSSKIQEKQKSKINSKLVFPNPSNGIITIQTKNKSPQQVFIFDLTGRQVAFFELSNPEQSLNLNFLPKSTYIVKIFSEENTEVIKLILR